MDISVLIPLTRADARLPACVESLERTMPRRVGYEIIVAAAEADTGDFAAPLRVIRCDGAHGHAAAVNAAAAAARGPLFCLLDPGATLMSGWLDPMLTLLRRQKNVGVIGNIHREPYSGLIDHAGITFESDGLPVPAGRGPAVLPREPYDRRAAVSGACCLVMRDVFARLGGFDVRFQHRFGDVDFCLRAATAGYRHYVANRSAVYHHAARSGPGHADDDLRLYRERWGDRARATYRQMEVLRARSPYSPSNWEMGREARRQQRQVLLDAHRDGLRYLRKHAFQPWRYNYGRICRALVQSIHPLPAAIPPLPVAFADLVQDASVSCLPGDDAALFFPPRRP